MSNKATDFKSVAEMPLEAEIDAREVKKTVKRVMKLIVKESHDDDEAFEALYSIKHKATGERNVNISEECSFTETDLSQQECAEVQKQLIKAIRKQLKGKHSFLVTARLLQALEDLTDEKLKKLNQYSKKAEMVYNIMEHVSCYEDAEEVFELFSKLDKI